MKYDVIVVGGGHAGCEACHATAKMGLNTALITSNIIFSLKFKTASKFNFISLAS